MRSQREDSSLLTLCWEAFFFLQTMVGIWGGKYTACFKLILQNLLEEVFSEGEIFHISFNAYYFIVTIYCV